MTDDLVKRLLEPVIDPFFGPLIEPIKKEAADCIKELEAALREIVDALETPNKGHELTDIEFAKNLARVALGEKKDEAS